ncbi:MAG: hypothetical protein WAV09_02560 [Minisyncoccia bacterium]
MTIYTFYKKPLILVLGVCLIVGGAIFYGYIFSQKSDQQNEVPEIVRVYTNPTYDFSFEYSGRYILSTREGSDRFEIILIDKNDYEEVRSEGPVSINIQIYKNISDLDAWLATSASNFQLALGPKESVALGGIQAVGYEWDGLYRGRTIAVVHQGNIFVLSGTYLEKDDSVYRDFDALVRSFVFTESTISEAIILDYLKKNISTLAPEKEVLGGTFYVTEFTRLDSTSGIVEYEDGHNAYKAKVVFSLHDDDNIAVTSFVLTN